MIEVSHDSQKAKSNLWKKGCLIAFGLGALLVVALIGALIWLGSGPEAGVRLSNEIEPYALEYIEANDILLPNEEIVAYYDYTVRLDSSEAAILTNERIIHHVDGRNTAIALTEIQDIQHRYESLIGDIIEISSTSGEFMKIEIAPLNQGETFKNVLESSWQASGN